MSPLRARFRWRKAVFTTMLAVTPWLPGLAAFPLLAATSTPALGLTPPAPADAGDPGAGPGPEPGEEPEAALVGPRAGGAEEADPVPPGGTPHPEPEPDPDELWVDVSLSAQQVRVYRGRDLLRAMVASTGVPDKPTPVGSFRLQNRGEWFFSEKYQQGGWWWVSFKDWGVYLFHSVPTDRDRQVLPEEAARLGKPASHGCIRLAIEDARWFYEALPQGTRVEIHP